MEATPRVAKNAALRPVHGAQHRAAGKCKLQIPEERAKIPRLAAREPDEGSGETTQFTSLYRGSNA